MWGAMRLRFDDHLMRTIDHSDALRLIVGRFKNAFSRENLEACFDPLTMDRAEVVSYTPWGELVLMPPPSREGARGCHRTSPGRSVP